jgi:hypothetical protein
VDDRPYGGGPGMVMMPEPLERALRAARQRQKSCGVKDPKVVYFTPQGRVLDHPAVTALQAHEGLILLCGRYEGVDERLVARQVDYEVSIGDYVLSAAAAGDGADGCPGAPGAGRARRRRLGGAGILRSRAAGLPPLHAARGIRRPECPGGAAVGQSRRDHPLAVEAVARPHLGAAARPDGARGIERRAAGPAGRISARVAPRRAQSDVQELR